MCFKVEVDKTPYMKKRIGYKIVRKLRKTGEYKAVFVSYVFEVGEEYQAEPYISYSWRETPPTTEIEEGGFNSFLTLKDAKECLESLKPLFPDLVVVKVKVRKVVRAGISNTSDYTLDNNVISIQHTYMTILKEVI